MTALSAHEVTRTLLCSMPGCPNEAEAGVETCAHCSRRDRGARDAEAERKMPSRTGGRPATWTREKALDHLRSRAINGVAPPQKTSGISTSVVARLFGTYAEMIKEAGLTSQRATRHTGVPISEVPAAPVPSLRLVSDDEEQPEGLVENARALLAAAEKVEDAYTDLADARDAVVIAKAEYRAAIAKVALL